MKLIEKIRVGSKVTKRYSKPKTPYRRIMESDKVSEEVKERLKEQYDKLNPIKEKRKKGNKKKN